MFRFVVVLNYCVFVNFLLADTFIYSDFDLTLNSDRNNDSWNTNMILFPIQSKDQLNPIILPYRFFNKIKNKLSVDCNQENSLKTNINISFDGFSIVFNPSFYCYNQESFIFHRSLDNVNYLLEDFEKAVIRHATSWQGPFFEFFARALSNPIFRENTGIITAREQTRRHWLEMLQSMKKKKYIPQIPNMENVHNVSLSEYDYLVLGKPHWESTPERKAKLIQEILESSSSLPVNPNDPLSQYISTGKRHVFIFADDHQHNIKQAHELFQQLAISKKFNFDYVLFNAGTEEEVVKSGRPKFYKVNPNGTVRPLEYKVMLDLLSPSCVDLF